MELIPTQRLITTVLADRKYQMLDDNRHVLWTGLIQIEFAKSRKISLKGLLSYDNLGVINGLNMLCLKNLSLSTSSPSENSSSSPLQESLFEDFMEMVLQKELSCSISSLPEHRDSLFETLKNPAHKLHDAIYHPAFLSDEEFSNLCIHTHRLVRHEMLMRNQGTEACSICAHLNVAYYDQDVIFTCQGHFMLSNFLGVHSKLVKGKPIAGQYHSNPSLNILPYRPPSVLHPIGSALVDTMRIGCMHSIENKLINDICKASFKGVKDPLLDTYTREEVIRLLRYTFPNYAQYALEGFKTEGLLHKLGLNRLKPIPSILNI